MKPDEVKNGLLVHSTSICDDDCPYFGLRGSGVYCSNEMCGDALSLIKQLESKLNQAVEDMKMLGRMGQNICPVCANYNHGEGSKQCVSCPKMDNFRWRGVVTKEARRMDQRWYEMTISKFVDQVLSGEKTLLQIERHMIKTGWTQQNIDMTMKHVRDRISERKKGNGKLD